MKKIAYLAVAVAITTLLIMQSIDVASLVKQSDKQDAEIQQIVTERAKIKEKIAQVKSIPAKEYLGEYTVTAYCSCAKCCGKKTGITASGAKAVEGVTVGADWATLPKGTVIEIEGIGERIVQDKPAKWIVKKYGGKIIDLYVNSHADAEKFGKQKLKVWVKNDETGRCN